MSFSNTFDTTNPGSAVSNREDLTDVLTILAPEETPVLSSASKKKATATFSEWTVDKLQAPVTTGVSEGADVTTFDDKFAERARLGNYVQKFRRDYMVSDLQEAVDSVGPAKVAQAESKAIRELKRDVEATILSDNDRSVENGAGTNYGLRGLGKWLADGTTIAGTPSDIPAAYATPTANNSDAGNAYTETILNTQLSEIFRQTGESSNMMLVADTGLRRRISDFARLSANVDAATNMRQVNMEQGQTTIKLSVELYESDHGVVSIVNMNPDTAPATVTGANTDHADGYIINPNYVGIHDLIPMGSTRLPNLGGGERGFVDCALTLGVYHPAAHGKIVA
jgi:SpoU rRNA methylase family enzyme